MNEQHNIKESDITLEPQSQRIIREHFESLSTKVSRYREALESARGHIQTVQNIEAVKEINGVWNTLDLALSQINEALKEEGK